MLPRNSYEVLQFIKVIVLTLFIISHVPNSAAENETQSQAEQISSPLYTLQNFRLHLEFPENLQTKKYTGISQINFLVVNPTNIIVVNAEVSEITKVDITSKESSVYANHTYAQHEGHLYVYTSEELVRESYHLTVNFVGEIRVDFIGFYLVTYENERGETELMLGSNMKPNFARKAFPCFDAPYYRALFHLDVEHSNDYRAISNRERSSFKILNKTTVHTTFEGTALMPAYQISLSLIRFKSMGFERNIDYSAYGRYEACGLAFALNASSHFLRNMFEYVQSGSAQNKIDIVAIPTDRDLICDDNLNTALYSEHWIEFRDNEQTTLERVEIAIRVARAIAHHNFGFYLAPHMWRDSWLSDGFANWLAYKSAKEVYPEWNIDQFFIVLEYQRTLHLDDDKMAIPIVPQLIDDSTEVPIQSSVFISKAACVVRMLEHMLGSDNFSQKIRSFVQSSSKLVTTESFIKHFLNVETMDSFLSTWLNAAGYPLVTAIRNFSENYETVHLRQSPFGNNVNTGNKWQIPFNIVPASDPNFIQTKPTGIMTPEGDINPSTIDWGRDDWIILNSQVTGFYRINYDTWNWKLLTDALWRNPESIHVNNRAQLLDDAFRLAEKGVLSYEIPLNLSVYLKNELELAPWSAAYEFFRTLKHLFSNIDEANLLRFYIQQITNEPYLKVGFEESNVDAITLKVSRAIITELACQAWNEKCFCTAYHMFDDFIRNDKDIRPNFRKTVLCTIIGSTSRRKLDMVWKKFFRSSRRTERTKLLYLLGCSRDERFLREIIQRIFETPAPTDYFQHERNFVIEKMADKGPEAALASMKILKKPFYRQVLHKEAKLASTLKKIAENTFDENARVVFSDLLDDAMESEFISKSQYDDYIEIVENNLKWVSDNHDVVLRWLKNFRETTVKNTPYMMEEPKCEIEIDTVCGCGCGCDENNSQILNISFWLQILLTLVTSIM